MYSTLRPLIPPSALIFSKAAVTPSFCGMPDAATGPVSGNQPPTLIGSLPRTTGLRFVAPASRYGERSQRDCEHRRKAHFLSSSVSLLAIRIDLISIQSYQRFASVVKSSRSRCHFR